ncbi:MAG: hypothetical protein M1827_002537 [Pycnora praestabilis]|nr:MAG: hypothetical protein M1827_002537 [Pycnora praestabilis]
MPAQVLSRAIIVTVRAKRSAWMALGRLMARRNPMQSQSSPDSTSVHLDQHTRVAAPNPDYYMPNDYGVCPPMGRHLQNCCKAAGHLSSRSHYWMWRLFVFAGYGNVRMGKTLARPTRRSVLLQDDSHNLQPRAGAVAKE